jgi:hypothetical protein
MDGLFTDGLPNLWFDVALGSLRIAVDALVEPSVFGVIADDVFVLGFAFAVVFAMIITPLVIFSDNYGRCYNYLFRKFTTEKIIKKLRG